MFLGEHVPQAKLHLEPPVVAEFHLAGHQGLSIQHPPVGEAQSGLDLGGALDERPRIDGFEQPRALEVGGNDAADLGTQPSGFRMFAIQIGHRDRHRLDRAANYVDLDLSVRRSDARGDPPENRQNGRPQGPSPQSADGFRHGFVLSTSSRFASPPITPVAGR